MSSYGSVGRGKLITAMVSLVAFVAASVGVLAPETASALVSPQQLAIRDGLQTVSDALAGLDGLDELAQTLPLSGLLPTSGQGLDVVQSLKAILDDALAAIDSNSADGAIADALNGLDGTSVGAGVIAHVAASVTDDHITFNTLELTRTSSTALQFATDSLSLDGASLSTELNLSFTNNGPLVMTLDSTGPPQLYIPASAPSAVLSADLALDVDPGLALDLGILTVKATGDGTTGADITASVDFTIDWLDPDSDGRISLLDLTTAAPLDLFDVTYAASSVDLDLTVAAASALLTGLAATGTISLHDANLADGLNAPIVNLPELENFTSMTPEGILTAIAQLAVALQAMQTRVANPDVPVIGADPNAPAGTKTIENLADLLDINGKIGDFFVSEGLSTAESPFELKIGDTNGNGTIDVGEVTLDSLGLNNIDSIIDTLATYLADSADLAYDEVSDALTFNLSFGASFNPPPAVVSLNDQLDSIGLKGLSSLNGTSGISFNADYNVDIDFGIDLTPVPSVTPITDRLFFDTTGVELTGDARVCADVNLSGTLGFLELSLADDDADPADVCPAGQVPLLDRRSTDPTAEMVKIDLSGGADNRIALSDLFADLGSIDANLAGNVFTLTGPNASVVGTINASVPSTTVAASAAIGGTDLAGANLTFAWPDIFGAPTVSGDANFNDDFLAFNIDSSNPLALFNSIIDTIDKAIGALDTIDGDDPNSFLDEDLPIIGTSFRDSVAFLGDVRDTINQISQDPAGSLQRLESQVELAIAQGLGVDLSSLGSLPDLNDPAFINDNGTADTGDDFFDDAAFQQALNDFYDAVQAFFTGDFDFVTLGYEPGNSPGAVTISLKLGVCSTIDANHPGCTKATPLSKAFNFNFDAIGGDFAGLLAAETAGDVTLDYNASFQLDLGVQLPDVATSQFTPRPFISDTSFVDLSIAGLVNGSFDATIGPFEVKVGNLSPVAEEGANCANDTDDDGDGFVNDGCPIVGATAEGISPNEAQCAAGDATDDDTTDDETTGVGTVNDGCPAQAAAVRAEAGAAFHLEADFGADSAPTRVYILEGTNLTDFLDDIVTSIPASLTANPEVDCGTGTPVFACASLPIFVNAGGPDIYLGTIDGTITSLNPFTHTFDSADIDAIKDALIANGAALAWQLVGQGLQKFGDYIEDATKGASYDIDVPVIGDVLDAGAAIGEGFNQNLAQPIGSFLANFNPSDVNSIKAPLQQEIFDLIGPSPGAGLLEDTNGPAGVDLDDITITLLCGDDKHECESDGTAPDDSVFDVVDLSVRFTIGDVIAEAPEIPFDFGFPGLRLATADGTDPGDAPDGIKAAVNWSIDVGFGLSLEDGFYLITDGSTPEIELGVHVNTPDFVADVAFLGIEIDGDNSDTPKPATRADDELSLTLSIDLPDDGDGKLGLSDLANVDPKEFLPVLTGTVDLYWRIATAPDFGGADTDSGAMPTLRGTLNVTATVTLSVDGLDFSGMAFGFDDIALDLGTFIDDFLGPILKEVQNFTKPLQPVIDLVSTPIPGISQLAELVGADPITMLSLFEAISGNDLTLIKTLLKVITFVNSLPTEGSVVGDINIGNFTIDLDKILDTELPANQKNELISFSAPEPGGIAGEMANVGGDFAAAFADNLSAADPNDFETEEPGFTFPAFQDFSQLFNLLVGQDVTLVRFASGPLKAEFGFSQSFGPIAVGPIPVSIVISGSASIEGRFAVGYDTKGIRQLVQMLTDGDTSNDDFLTGFGFLFNGLFLDDLNAAGQDVPEIRLVVEFAAGAAVDLVIVSAGVEGGVRATLDLNLHDGGFFNPIPPENLDGKLRLDEIASFLTGNPLCLFDVSGKLEAFIRIFVEIDLFLFSARFEFTVVNITLLELDDITKELCEPPPPVLATNIGDGVLRLNMGPNAGARNYSPDTLAEKFVVKQLAAGTVEVSAFGLSQVFGPNEAGAFQMTVGEVVADGGTDKDTLRFDPGSVESVATGDIPETENIESAGDVVSVEVPFTIPTEVCGGPNDDKVSGGEGADKVAGDGAQNGAGGGNGWACVLTEAGTDGADQLGGLGANDIMNGGGGGDLLVGDNGNDTLSGGSGDDAVNGGIGQDVLNGNADNDNIKGGADRDPALVSVPDDESNDTIDGGSGNDTIDADFGDDTIFGGTENDVIVAGPGIDSAHGQAGEDIIFGNDGSDASLDGGPGDDNIFGMLGDDNIRGGPDDDNLIGNEGDDDIEGLDGKDVILGDNGEINRNPDPGGSSLDVADPLKPLVTLTSSTGAAGDTDLSGGSDTDVIWGDEGNDFIEGGAGNDDLHGNVGNDTISGDADADTMFGDSGTDTMYGDNSSAGNGCGDLVDVIKGGDDNDTISGNGAGDSLFGDNGDDLVYGDADSPNAPCDGVDTAYGGPIDDYIFGNANGDQLSGQGGIDRLVGGSDDANQPDGDDTIDGGTEDDVIAGDNATIGDSATAAAMLVTLRLDGRGTGDHIFGQSENDRIHGQTGDDNIVAGSGSDYVEGNDGVDTISGGLANDDLIGGGSANDGVIDANRVGTGLLDTGDIINGGGGSDFIAGDNAIVNRNLPASGRASVELFDNGTTAAPAAVGTSGADVITGDGEADQIFGQAGNDTVSGGTGTDYIEGNNGDDTITGDDDNDDLVGGGSANDGVIDADRVGNTLLDVAETLIAGGNGEDWIAGDNALIDRNIPIGAVSPIRLFDVETVAAGPLAGTGGGEVLITGDSGPDWIFGQTGNDTIHGNADADYVEGNNGNDAIFGDSENDDLVGGGSSNDGIIDNDRVGNGLLDGAETLISGGTGMDWITGDNALVNRNRPTPGRAPIELFDVDADTTVPGVGTSGGEALIDGGADNDELFGQGGNDIVTGGDGADYIEGNHANDTISGNNQDDDIIGGGSADDGKIDADRVGNHLDDGRDTINGNDGNDWITGDNAIVIRSVTAAVGRAPIELFDVQTAGGVAVMTSTSGGDTISGDAGLDRIFGGGNGTQPATQTDPVDTRNNDFVDTVPASSDFNRLTGIADEDTAGWTGDVIRGGLGDDYIEGNHGNDLIFGNGTAGTGQDEDDIAGGGSANDGKIFDNVRLGLGANLLDGFDTIHGDSIDNTIGDDDAIVGDNAFVKRLATKQIGPGPDGGQVDQWDRDTQMTNVKAAAGTFANDFISGNGGHDELFGQQGNDYIEGGYGSDAMVGDLGKVTTDLFTDMNGNSACGIARTINPNEPFVRQAVCQPGTLFRLVQLYAFDDTITSGPNAVAAGNDVMLGLDGDDWMHGGAGVDLMNGDGDAGPEFVDPLHTYTTDVTDPNLSSADVDHIFGGDSNGAGTVSTATGGNGDVVWGGRGSDHTYGGRGDDMLEVRPNPLNTINFPATWSAWAEADVESYHGIDFVYGGFDQDAMQGNVADNGPVFGDRLFDWVGAYNIYYLCPATYGAYVSIRDQSPAILIYFQDQARTDGALSPVTSGTSGFNELALVYKPDVGSNSHPIYPGTPGHFFCG